MYFAKRERMILHLASRAVPNEVIPFLVANRLGGVSDSNLEFRERLGAILRRKVASDVFNGGGYDLAKADACIYAEFNGNDDYLSFIENLEFTEVEKQQLEVIRQECLLC